LSSLSNRHPLPELVHSRLAGGGIPLYALRMAGWSQKKRDAVEKAFYGYLDQCWINSKDLGRICLGEHLYDGQRRLITEIFDALQADIHKIYVLKSRQLGVSTLIRALMAFLLGIHPGLKGAVVFDSDTNRLESRVELTTMIKDLPLALHFPAIGLDNRAGLTLQNDSRLLFLSAGVKKSKTSGTLGRSVGLSLAHCSELCSWDNDEGLEAFEQSLSDNNPDRLYVYESTARGFNKWHDMWEEARKDPDHCRCIFLGWWSKESQSILREDKDFAKYGEYPPTEGELKKISAVREQYHHIIKPEQLAWIRRKMDPALQGIGDGDIHFDANPTRVQEQPWTESEAFQQTGAVFFGSEKLTVQTNDNVSDRYDSYMYSLADEFDTMFIVRAQNAKSVELKVWEPPERNAVYVMGIDTAHGENESNDRSSAQILRCYADGLDQVAEYTWPLVTTQQYAWVIASLLGWYGSEGSEVRYILELNGPGTSVYTELKQLKQKLDRGFRLDKIEEKGLQNIFANVRTFIYSRPDSIGHGHNFHFKTTSALKVTIMEDLRNNVSNGILRVRSMDAIKEMTAIARDGDKISAPGSKKDDRVVSMALANYYWKNNIRSVLISQKRTRQAEAAKKQLSIHDQIYLFSQNQLSQFFADKQRSRRTVERELSRRRWRYGR